MKTIGWILILLFLILIGIFICNNKKGGKCPDNFFERMGSLATCSLWSSTNDISADGLRVVGQSVANCSSNSVHPVEAVGWTRPCKSGIPFYPGGKNGLIDLGNLPAPDPSSLAYGISSDGEVSVGFSDSILYLDLPVIFLPSGLKELKLHDPDIPGTAVEVSGKNSNVPSNPDDWGGEPLMKGRVVVGWEGNNHPHKINGINAYGVYWTSLTNVVRLEAPLVYNGKQVTSSAPTCISDDGQTIGGNIFYSMQSQSGFFRSCPCIWKWNGIKYDWTLLEDLPGGDVNARIIYISGNGKVAVGWGATVAGDSLCDAYPQFACKWSFAGGVWSAPLQLNPLPGTLRYSTASGTNNDGSIIVGSTYDYTGCAYVPGMFISKATLWDGTLIKDVEVELGTVVPAGYHLFAASRVSDNGKIIIGYSYPPGYESEGWIGGLK